MIVTVIVGSELIEDKAMEFLFYSILMFFDILLFMWLAHRYRRITAVDEL